MSTPREERPFLVLDSGDGETRSLVESVRGAGFDPKPVADIDELVRTLEEQRLSVAVMRFDALRPRPQAQLRRVRDAAPESKLLIGYAEGGPRIRLGRRLWAAGLCNQFFPLESPQPTITRLLRQAHAEIVMDVSSPERPEAIPSDSDQEGPERSLRILYDIVSGFGAHESIEGLLRELHISLPRMVGYRVLEVLVAHSTDYKLHVSPVAPVPHETTWDLAQRTCDAVSPFVASDLSPRDLVFIETPPLGVTDEEETPTVDVEHVETLPMILHGELVGCLTLLLNEPLSARPESHDLLRLLSVQLSASVRNLQRLESARREAMLDELTGAHNRRYFTQALRREWQRAGRYGFRLSVGVLDLDRFKEINDQHGHLVGDEVLKNVARGIQSQLREADHFVRYGGDEFVIVFPETGPSEAALVMERIRLQFQHDPVYRDDERGDLHLSTSAGVASYPECRPRAPEELFDRADSAAMEAKRQGRDCVWIASEDGLQPVRPDTDSRRLSPRVRTQVPVRYLEVPHFEPKPIRMTAANLSAGGAGVKGPRHQLKRNAYGLVYVGGDSKPVLSRIMWTRDLSEHETMAGMKFIQAEELERKRLATMPMIAMKALVVVEDSRTRAMVERVLRAANVMADFVSEPEGLEQLESLRGYSMVVVGQSSMRSPLGERLRQLRAVPLDHPVRIVVLNESADRRAALEAISRDRVKHLVGGQPGEGDESLFATLNKILLGEHFGIDKYLMWGADTRVWTVSSAEEKATVLEQVRATAHAMRCHVRIADLVVAAADEMIINALYRRADDEAPADAVEERSITVECGSDGRFFAIAVIDDFGLFEPDNMFDAIGRALEWEREGIPESATHAHLGFRIMLSGLSQLVVNVHPGRCTEVIGITDLRKSLRELRSEAPGLGLFRSED